MTRDQVLAKWCDAEGGKKSALDAPQAREAYAKLRAIIGEEIGIDLDDVIADRSMSIDATGFSNRPLFRAYPLHAWRNGKPAKSKR